MKKTLLFSSLAVGLALVGCNKSTRTSTAANDATVAPAPATTASTSTSTESFGSRVDAAADRASASVKRSADSASNAIGAAAGNARTQLHIAEWKLSNSDLQADLQNDRPIVRTKDSSKAGAPTGTMDKSVVESSVKAKLKADTDLAALSFDVNAQKDGEVELEGKAHSAEQVGKAIALALDTDGVNKVTSKFKLDRDAKKAAATP